MSGNRHHIVPRFLQKGFASRIIRKKKKEVVFTYRYLKNDIPPNTEFSTRDTIVSEYFYGKEGEVDADDEITEVEKYKFSPLVAKMRNSTCNFDTSKTEIAELIAHFSVRTKVVREGFTEMSQKWISGVREIFTSEDTIETVSNRKVIENELGQILAEADNEELKPLFEKFVFPLYQDDNFMKEVNSILGNVFSKLFDESNPSMRNSIKEGHNKSLLEHTIPQPRVEKYEQLNWSVYETTSTLILGDVACIFREIGEKLFKPSCDIDKTGQVYLPISSNKMLVGTIDTEEIETDVKILNDAIASCSYEQFVCSENTQDKANLIQTVGTNAYLASDDEIEIELDEIRNNIQIMKDEKINE